MNDARRRAAAPGELACDLVFKGGVTSGVIYPRLVARLAEVYRFRSIGGSSAGAMAAAAAAIAQLARNRGLPHDAFAAIDDLPAKLAETHRLGGTRLLNLFQPHPAAKRSFNVAATLLDSNQRGAVRKIAMALLATFWPAALVGATPGLWIVIVAAFELAAGADTLLFGGVLAFGVFFSVLLAALALVGYALYATVKALAANHLGLCSGMSASRKRGDSLTEWLHNDYNALLGRKPDADPVVFGELWGANGAGGERAIDLQVITTALNLRRPYRIPNDPGVDAMRGFYYDRAEWEQFFPDAVLNWLDTHARASKFAHRLRGPGGQPLRALPTPHDWPIVVAVRMSLSFPGLLSALPLYTIDWTLTHNRDAKGLQDAPLIAGKVYFSDGGIASNFPIHLFDAPLPRHPTFGVNLERLHPETRDDERIRRPDAASPGCAQHFKPFPDGAFHRVWQFVVAIVSTMHGWRDTMQQTMPGYRDRIVHIAQAAGEGGLNLKMDEARIARLAGLGRQAGERLAADFAGPGADGGPNAWQRHRWLRMRSALDSTGRYLERFAAAAADGVPAYRALPPEPPLGFPFNGRDTARSAAELIGDVERLVEAHRELPRSLGADAPRPTPSLRNSPAW